MWCGVGGRCRVCVFEFVALLGWLMLPLISALILLSADVSASLLRTLTCGVGNGCRVCARAFHGLRRWAGLLALECYEPVI